MAQFYAYLWLREDGTPYYAGKGSGHRAFARHRNLSVPANRTRIVVFLRSNEAEALATEKELIANWGREDLGTGCLLNFTDGGDSPPSWKGRKRGSRSPAHRQHISEANLGRKVWNKGISPAAETRKKIAVTLRGNQNAFGHIVSDEAKLLMSKGKKGKPSPRKGMTCSAESKQKMSAAARGRVPLNKGGITSDEVKHKQRVSALNRRKRERELR